MTQEQQVHELEAPYWPDWQHWGLAAPFDALDLWLSFGLHRVPQYHPFRVLVLKRRDRNIFLLVSWPEQSDTIPWSFS